MSFLDIQGITKRFNHQTALDGVTLGVERGELICILGPSGCGKTTLLRIIAGLETEDEGCVIMNGKDCSSLPASKRNFGIVFQSYALFPNMTVFGNILFGLRQKKKDVKEDLPARVLNVLRMVDLLEHKDKYPRQLSGGQQQRTALARAIALSPDYLLLDEPLSALDAKVRVKLRGEICKIQRTLGITTIMVTHDQEEALTMADRIVVMNNAVVEQIGTPHEIYNHPATPFVADFIGTMNFYNRNGSIRAIRPENVRLNGELSSSHNVAARVKSLEFRGALTRVYGTLPDMEDIFVDVPSEIAAKMRLHEDATVFLNFPLEHTVTYPMVV